LSVEWSQYCVVVSVSWNRYQLSVTPGWHSAYASSRSPEVMRLYSIPRNRAEASPACPSCWLEGRPYAEHVERLRFDWGTVFRPRQGNRYPRFRGCHWWAGRCCTPRAQCVGRKVAISNGQRRAMAGSWPSITSTPGRNQYTKRLSPRGVECSSEIDMARTPRRTSRASRGSERVRTGRCWDGTLGAGSRLASR
jgi:hypothetical protein